jgi:hypothetical protein
MGKKRSDRQPPDRSGKKAVTTDRDETFDDQDVCIKAPEWAEHQRLDDDDLPCDDGRSGRLDNR